MCSPDPSQPLRGCLLRCIIDLDATQCLSESEVKRILTILLATALLFAGCAQPSAPATTVPPIQDFAIYPEDKVAIERAEADIELNRKGDVLLTVTDSRGKPAPGISVKYKLVRHSFLFGVAVYCDKP